jgi:UDP-N-acetyl-D-galactosamine dehydrogenase
VKEDCVVMAVVHDEFKKMKLEDVKKFMNDNPVLVDVRRMFDEENAKRRGFMYKTL